MCATVFRAFLIWFAAQTPATQRALVKERALAYVDNPVIADVLQACPPDIVQAAEALRAAIKRSDWRG